MRRSRLRLRSSKPLGAVVENSGSSVGLLPGWVRCLERYENLPVAVVSSGSSEANEVDLSPSQAPNERRAEPKVAQAARRRFAVFFAVVFLFLVVFRAGLLPPAAVGRRVERVPALPGSKRPLSTMAASDMLSANLVSR